MVSRLFAAILSVCLLAGFFFFSAFVFVTLVAVLLPLGIGFYAYLRWRMRHLQQQMREGDPSIIEAEYSVVNTDETVTYVGKHDHR